MSQFAVPDVTFRGSRPSVQAAGDGLQGAYPAVLHSTPSGGICQVVIGDLSLTDYFTARCSHTLGGTPGDPCLVLFDNGKQPWVVVL